MPKTHFGLLAILPAHSIEGEPMATPPLSSVATHQRDIERSCALLQRARHDESPDPRSERETA
jgi:hypothetical protein